MPAHAAITTLTLNPAVDATYEVPRLIADQKVHALAVRYDPGGNGINVGRALKILGASAGNYCVTAGEIGQLLQRLLAGQVDGLRAEAVAGETRINVAVLEQQSASQYEVSAIGPALDAAALQQVENGFLETCGSGFGVLTGSVPPGVPADIYARLARRVRERGGRAVVDTYGELLRHTVSARPFLIKPNRYELEQYCGAALPTLEAVAAEARRLQRGGIDYVCVSLAQEGALLCGPDNTWHAPAPPVPVKCTVGAGDSMVAGLVFAFAGGRDPAQALRLAVACGTGTTQHSGTELFSTEDLNALSGTITVRGLDC